MTALFPVAGNFVVCPVLTFVTVTWNVIVGAIPCIVQARRISPL